MKNPPSYEVGYCRPPKRTQWQKGQCGNPKRIRKQNPKPIVDMIDEFFAGEIDIVEKPRVRPGGAGVSVIDEDAPRPRDPNEVA